MTYLTTVDILLLKILAQKAYGKSIKEIQAELRLVNINLCQRGIYQRVERLNSRKFTIRGWKKRTMIYAISEAGKFKLATFQEQLRA
ncbi:MAG: hypothetical protein JGK30_25945 [Microcoleus sp. PH2017_40_RAT_O_B]|uniref:hypothetical protein n=1 Tax=unclassified Microcoleus TaxID=2642155 RepID=UPI001D7F2543|nr:MULTISPECIES: hypothetical protein [unclassified Microcoleus]MCC3575240.1 hypothetical protein [Microcoleus sp. PH2017_34_RAT_O_A]MCC3612818.1 hypothetical protein [Microcoleus sp. PH2017_40_RAT_O_B]